MADDIASSVHPDCAEVRESIDLLALDALGPAERAPLMAHLDSCPECRAELDRAEETVGALMVLAPEVEVPDGFADRILAATAATAGTPGTPAITAGAPTPIAAGRARSSRWITVAVAGVAAALLLTALGVALGSVFASKGQVAAPPATAAPGARSAPLVTTLGGVAGSVVVDDSAGTLVMVVDAVAPGVPYDCVVRSASGDLVTVGSWTTAAGGPASWTVALDPVLTPVDQVLLVGPGRTTLATAQLT